MFIIFFDSLLIKTNLRYFSEPCMQEIINMPDNQQHNIEYDVTTLADADSVQVGTSIFSALLVARTPGLCGDVIFSLTFSPSPPLRAKNRKRTRVPL